MPAQFWVSLLDTPTPWQGTSGTALNTAATATISPQAAGSKDFTLPANYWYPGATIRVKACGLLTTTGTSTTLTVFLAAGSTPTTLATTAGMATGTGSLTGLPWRLDAEITCTGIGSSGSTLLTQGNLWIATSVTPAVGTANTVFAGLPSASGAAASALDTTSAMAVMLRATLAGANATIQCTGWDLEALN